MQMETDPASFADDLLETIQLGISTIQLSWIWAIFQNLSLG
jgi:hypothetical protein